MADGVRLRDLAAVGMREKAPGDEDADGHEEQLRKALLQHDADADAGEEIVEREAHGGQERHAELLLEADRDGEKSIVRG